MWNLSDLGIFSHHPLKISELSAKKAGQLGERSKELVQSRILTGSSYLLEKGRDPGPDLGQEEDLWLCTVKLKLPNICVLLAGFFVFFFKELKH